jgi:hypothetical protein
LLEHKNRVRKMAKKDSSVSKPAAKKGKPIAAKRSGGGGKKPTSDIRILSAIARQHAVGDEFACRKQVAVIAAMPNEGSYNTTINNMKKKGLVVSSDDNKRLKVTDEGYAKLGPEARDVPKTNEDIQNHMKQLLKVPKARDMFDLMKDGSSRSRTELAASIGFEETSGSFKTYLGSLSKYTDKVEGPNGTKMLQLKDMCFPFGRPNND